MSNDDDVRIAELCLDYGRVKEARRILTDLQRRGPADPQVLRLAAQASLADGAGRAALEHARKAVALEPESDWGWRLVSAAAAHNGDRDESKSAAATALRLDPSNWANHAQKVYSDIRGRRVPDDTWNEVTEAMRLNPDGIGPVLLAARLAASLGYLDESKTFYRQVLKKEATHPEAKTMLAHLTMEKNQMAEATLAYLDLDDQGSGGRALSRSLRRVVLRTLEWVNGILLVALILIGLLAILGSTAHEALLSAHIGEVVVFAATLGGLGLAWRAYRRGLGDRAGTFLRSLPAASPSLVVLAVMQAVVLVAATVVVLLLVVPIAGAVLAVASIIAAGLVFLALIYAGLLHTTL